MDAVLPGTLCLKQCLIRIFQNPFRITLFGHWQLGNADGDREVFRGIPFQRVTRGLEPECFDGGP